MFLREFAVAVGVDSKWVQNAHAALGLPATYAEEGAMELALTRLLEEEGLRLADAHQRARRILGAEAEGQDWPDAARAPGVRVLVDRAHFLSRFALNLALARTRGGDERRGRPRTVRERGVVAAAAYGVDLSLLDASLARSVAARLDRLDEDVAFLQSLRVRRS